MNHEAKAALDQPVAGSLIDATLCVCCIMYTSSSSSWFTVDQADMIEQPWDPSPGSASQGGALLNL